MDRKFITPALDETSAEKVVEQLQFTLSGLNDWALILKHAHWNVTGPGFIGVHEMLDPQIDKVREAADTVGERIATVGGAPDGRSERIAKDYAKTEFDLGKYPIDGHAGTLEHLQALDDCITPLILGLRDAIEKIDPIDVISSNILQEIVQDLEFDQWFYRSHLK
jgi:starvation-inducible DNA-binding protein